MTILFTTNHHIAMRRTRLRMSPPAIPAPPYSNENGRQAAYHANPQNGGLTTGQPSIVFSIGVILRRAITRPGRTGRTGRKARTGRSPWWGPGTADRSDGVVAAAPGVRC